MYNADEKSDKRTKQVQDIATYRGVAQDDAWKASKGGLLEEPDGGSGEKFDAQQQLQYLNAWEDVLSYSLLVALTRIW